MSDRFRFYKEESGKWYIFVPDWPYDNEALEMIAGADHMLDVLSNNGNEVTLELSTSIPSKFGQRIVRLSNIDCGANYIYVTDNPEETIYDFPLWLCPVTVILFNEYPDIIYIDVVS